MLKYCDILLKLLRDVKVYNKKLASLRKVRQKNITNTPKHNHLLREQTMYFLNSKRLQDLKVTVILKKYVNRDEIAFLITKI